MKKQFQKISELTNLFFNKSTWSIIALSASALLICGLVLYSFNFFSPTQQQVVITAQEFRNNKIGEDLSNDEFESGANFEEYNAKLKKIKSYFPNSEWEKTEIVISDAEFKKAQEDYKVQMKQYYEDYYSGYSDGSEYPSQPQKITQIPYSMKGFMDKLLEGYDIDSVDFDKKIEILDKIEFFVGLTNKKNLDTLFHEDFIDLLKKSKNISLNEMKTAYQIHQNLTKTKIVYGEKEKPFERRPILFNLLNACANNEVSEGRFETVNQLIDYAKNKIKVKDTLVLANISNQCINLNLSHIKDVKTTDDFMESEAINQFMTDDNLFNLKDDNFQNQFNSYLTLFTKKTEMAHVEFLAREILRKENRGKGLNWVFYGLLFFSLAAMIVVTIRNSQNK